IDAKRVCLPAPFDWNVEWGFKPVDHVRGMMGLIPFRGPMEVFGDGWGVNIGPVWRWGGVVVVGAVVEVSMETEGRRCSDLPADLSPAQPTTPSAAPPEPT